MRQSRLMSLVEAGAYVVIGYAVPVATQLLALFGLKATLGQNLTIGLMFAVVSLVRSYALRPAFEALRSAEINR